MAQDTDELIEAVRASIDAAYRRTFLVLIEAETLLAGCQHNTALDDETRRRIRDYFSDHERGQIIRAGRQACS